MASPHPIVNSQALGTWYLNANGYQVTLQLSEGASPGNYHGKFINENAGVEVVDNITYDLATGVLDFRRVGTSFWQWYHGNLVEGIVVGRFSHDANSAIRPATFLAYKLHFTGWNSSYLDEDIVPRVFDVVINTDYRGTLRLDRNADGSGFAGRLKVYATKSGNLWDAAGEELEYDLEVRAWDGTKLAFTRRGNGWTQAFTGAVSGRTISGTFTQTQTPRQFAWQGTRANVLTYGLSAKSAAQRDDWQVRTRRQIERLIMQGNPQPLSVTTTARTLNGEPFPDGSVDPNGRLDRDDDPGHWPRNYSVNEYQLDYTLPNPYGPDPMMRQSHLWLAVPSTPPPGGKWRAVLAVNGHSGVKGRSGAWAMMDPTDGDYWYGEAFARRGYVVLAVDISHRPALDSVPLYQDPNNNGNDPQHGNGSHPAIQASELPHDSDWEEDGERAWDASRALDLLLSGQFGVAVDPMRVLVTGLSLGGEMATIIGALDARLTIVIPAGFSPDLNVIKYHGNHPCWQWKHADVCEYLDASDYHSLTAPRALIVQTGSADSTFSSFNPPFAADKQVARRSRAAFGDETGRFLHYLQPYRDGELAHQYRVGDRLSSQPQAPGVGLRVSALVEPPQGSPWSLDWQTDGNTTSPSVPRNPVPTLFDCIDHFWS